MLNLCKLENCKLLFSDVFDRTSLIESCLAKRTVASDSRWRKARCEELWRQGRLYWLVKEGMLSIRHVSLLVTILVRGQSVNVEDGKEFYRDGVLVRVGSPS